MMSEQGFEQYIAALNARRDLSADEAANAIDTIISGGVDDARIEQFLRAMMAKGESIEELVGGATAMRRHVTRIECLHPSAIDTCGTGGDGISTFNVSTAAAIVAAGAGAVVAKHGNRTNTRRSGSAEVLTALGVNIEAPPEVVAACVNRIGVGFLFAARLHPAMAKVVHIRRKIGKPTIFNLLGPLTNPAFVKRQIIGVPRHDLVGRIAGALARLGATHALVVHGDDGLCDFTVTAASKYAEVRDGGIEERELQPEAVGFRRATLDDLKIDSPERSAEVIRAVLAGDRGPPRDHTLLNAAAALVVAGVSPDFQSGVTAATGAIDTGRAHETLQRLVELTAAGATDA